MKALVIEDSQIYRKIVENALTGLGIFVRSVETAKQGFSCLSEERFDFVCLDLHLPDINGLEFCRRFRAQAANRLIPVLLLTSEDDESLIYSALNAGITEVFRKSNLEHLHNSLSDYARRMAREYQGRVLLVEDSATTSSLLNYMLQQMSLEVDCFDTVEAALDSFKENDYDLIISDVVLAGEMSGLGLVREVRAMTSESGRVPILGLSALEDAARKIEMLRLGANDYVPKPVIQEEFIARVGNLISNKQLFDQVQRQRKELKKVSVTDQLTGLYNRHYLAEVSVQMISNAHRKSKPLSMLMVDLDFFKKINDNNGHDIGDKVLQGVGKLVRQSCRGGDVAARFGGEEFVILLYDCNATKAEDIAQRLLLKVRELKPQGLNITASIGVSVLEHETKMTFDELFKLADEALYVAKNAGRDQVLIAGTEPSSKK